MTNPLTAAASPMYKFCMIGNIRTKEKCPACQGNFEGQPLRCKRCKTVPRRYYIDFSWPGQGKIKLYSDKNGYSLSDWEQANRALNALRYEIDQGVFDPRDYVKKDVKALKFDAYLAAWLAKKEREVEQGQKSKGYMHSVKVYANRYLLPFFRARNIRDINEGMIEDFKDSLPIDLAPKTVANILGILHKLMSDALRRRDIQRLPEFPKIAKSDPKIKWLEPEDQYRILSEVKDPVRNAFFLFLMKTGCRPGEARALKWNNIDFKTGEVSIWAAMDLETYRPFTKERDARRLPLHPEVIAALKALPRSISGFVFTYQGKPLHRNTIKREWSRAAQKAGIDIGCYQGTKHSFGWQMLNQGIRLEVVSAWFGHKDPRTTKKYAGLITGNLKYWGDDDEGPK